MRIAVLISGVLDYRRPIEKPSSGNWLDVLDSTSLPYRLSPFDEAALEVALRLVEIDSNHLTIITTDCSTDKALICTLVAYKPDNVVCLSVPSGLRGNSTGLASFLSEELAQQRAEVDLWLMGREMGDLDDGHFVPYLAQCWNLPLLTNTLVVATQSGELTLQRLRLNRVEEITVQTPVLVSMTNDRRNRLRHPLMKNLALAKRQLITPRDFDAGSLVAAMSRVQMVGAEPVPNRYDSPNNCQILRGERVDQAREFARLLLDKTQSI
jgi:electron transfer flavoprotein beta subunit